MNATAAAVPSWMLKASTKWKISEEVVHDATLKFYAELLYGADVAATFDEAELEKRVCIACDRRWPATNGMAFNVLVFIDLVTSVGESGCDVDIRRVLERDYDIAISESDLQEKIMPAYGTNNFDDLDRVMKRLFGDGVATA